MIGNRLSKRLVLTTGLVVALGALGASEVFAQRARSRSSVSSGTQSSGGSGRSVATRSGRSGGSRGAGVTRTSPCDRGGSRGHGGRHGYRGHRPYRYGFGIGYGGYYGWGGYWGYGGYYYSPFYYHYPVYYSYHPRRFDDFGSLDLNVRPKKTEIWVDGQYVGPAGRFDGYPGHLWLEEGPHELIFFRQGHETIVREVNVLEGVMLDVALDMQPGEAVPAEQVTAFTQEELRRRRESRDYRSQIERRDPIEQHRNPGRSADRKDVREEPGRLTLDIDPIDASIYLDGRFLGTGAELERLHSGLIVAPGEHTLEVVRPGFSSEEVPFSVDPGEQAALEVVLDAV